MLSFTSLTNYSLRKALSLWLLSNLGGTILLTIDFALDRPADFSIGLFSGLLAALVSLLVLPFCVPLFRLLGQLSTCSARRTIGTVAVLGCYAVTNFFVLHHLPVVDLRSLVTMSLPYLAAALAAVYFLCEPAPPRFQNA
ncbi:hypothetical protein MUN82_00550 [Hymenobacter aerilatus]|uniref:Uncharacterized protein n=1 Tax=Hymenobacter aerilatus TaxID=2932251 RepID=A0A8T9SUQ2_9BACT|nr:hypothetical protein [Hymenobacter aerilatus]UOR05605.1 hypothetical protein MUN82_00550 [Hymenobacter aerilatus]